MIASAEGVVGAFFLGLTDQRSPPLLKCKDESGGEGGLLIRWGISAMGSLGG